MAYFEAHIEQFELPVRYRSRVIAVEPFDAGYLVSTDEVKFESANVVIATGLHQQPKIPPFSANPPTSFQQISKSRDATASAVLVAGSAQSGCQIAQELY